MDYCLKAEGISLDDIDLVVRNCYVLSGAGPELRLVSEDVPEVRMTSSARWPKNIHCICQNPTR